MSYSTEEFAPAYATDRKRARKRERDHKGNSDDRKIIVRNPVVMTNLITEVYGGQKIVPQKPEDFDWSIYANGWNGTGLNKQNMTVKTEAGDKVFDNSTRTQSLYNKYLRGYVKYDFDATPKDFEEGQIIKIHDLKILSKDELLVTTTAGNGAIVNMNKEGKFFEAFGKTKEEFKEIFNSPEAKQKFIKGEYYAKIESTSGRASLYDGMLYKTQQEFLRQIELGDKATNAYNAHIENLNRGGYIVIVQGIRAFLPGSQAATNKINNFESLLDTDIIVMIEGYDPNNGFIVSHKKYLKQIMPGLMAQLRKDFENNPDKIYTGTVTGTKPFGIFVELSEYYTGLVYKMYASDELLDKLENGEIHSEDKLDVYIHSISRDNYGHDRIVLSDIPYKDRRSVIDKREKEMERQQKIDDRNRLEYEKKRFKEEAGSQSKNFKGRTINSFSELNKLKDE